MVTEMTVILESNYGKTPVHITISDSEIRINPKNAAFPSAKVGFDGEGGFKTSMRNRITNERFAWTYYWGEQ